MKKFAIKLFVFGLLLYFINIVLTPILRNRAINDRHNKMFWVMEMDSAYFDVAVMGPSSVYNAINPIAMRQREKSLLAINISFHGISIMEQYLITQRFLKQNKTKMLLLYMHPPVLHSPYMFNKPSNIYTFLPYVNEEPLVKELIKREHPWHKRILWSAFPLSAYIEFNNQYNFQNEPTPSLFDTTLGFSPYTAPFDSMIMKRYFAMLEKQELLEQTNGVYQFEVDTAVFNWYQKFYELCQAEGVQLVLFEQPIKEPYYSYASYAGNKKYIQDWAKNNQVPYLDFSDHADFKAGDYFYDDIHLNDNGAEVLSKLLADSVAVLRKP